MSFLKSKAIVLKKKRMSDKEFIYTVFSYEFGKIDCKKKVSSKEKPLDIGYDINFEIFWKNAQSLATIRNINILHELKSQDQNYETIFSFMQLMHEIDKNTEKWIPVYAIYELMHELHQKKITLDHVILAWLKLKHILWILPGEHENQTVQRILNFIYKNPIQRVLLLVGIEPDIQKMLKELTTSHAF